MLDGGLRIVATAIRRADKLESRSGIERDNTIIRSARGDGGIGEHRRRRVTTERPAVGARWNDTSGQLVCRKAGIGGGVIGGLCIGLQGIDVGAPRGPISQVVTQRDMVCGSDRSGVRLR